MTNIAQRKNKIEMKMLKLTRLTTSRIYSVPLLIVFLSVISHQTHAAEDFTTAGLKTVIRIYDECSKSEGGFVPCLKKKAITFLDRISLIDTIAIGEGIKVIRATESTNSILESSEGQPAEGMKVGRILSENDLESTLARGSDDRDTALTNLLLERVVRFFRGHTLQINLPMITSDEMGRAIEEGRGKMKKMMGMMMMGVAMKMVGLIPVAIAGLYILAGKALIVSKIALLLAGVIGLKKLLSGRGGSSGGSSGGWQSGGSSGWSSGGGGGGGSGGWDKRSLEEETAAQNLAYRSYAKAE